MATPAQIQANRLNAQKSTGPRSAEGKSASRFNALKHGRDAESLVIPGEDPEALAQLTAEYYQQCQPDGPIERHYVDAMIESDWLRRRLRRCEAQLYNTLTEGDESGTPLGAAWQRDASGPNALQKIFRQISALDCNYARALAELRRLQTNRQTGALEAELELAGAGTLALMQSTAFQPHANTTQSRPIGFVPPVGQASLPVFPQAPASYERKETASSTEGFI